MEKQVKIITVCALASCILVRAFTYQGSTLYLEK